MYKKLLLILGFVFTVTAVNAISICKGTGSTGGGSSDFPSDKTFVMTILTPADRTFSFQISASGNYKVDWGDGTAVENITKSDTVLTTYSHTYPAASTNYTAKLAGLATGYNSDQYISAILFNSDNPKENLIGISGNLGYIFPIINNTTTGTPKFYFTFGGCTKITGTIPENLFAGINGAPVLNMFGLTFSGCTGLTGSIPENLFSGIVGAPAQGMFSGTFYGCTGLTGSIPENLFAGISGAPAGTMFQSTFYDCTGLTGAIPSGLFDGISGAPAESMFNNTFFRCTGLTGSISENLFAKIVGAPATAMFGSTFYGCTGLTGAIPGNLFSGIVGAPAQGMFGGTFRGCTGLTSIPVGLFGNLSGTAASNMFAYTFTGCTGLTGQSALMPDGVTHLYQQWPSATPEQVWLMYRNATGLADYSTIPANWK